MKQWIVLILWMLSGIACGTAKRASRPGTTPPNRIEEPARNKFKNRAAIVTYAKKYLGTPYVYGGADPGKGFDCSGFVQYVFKHFNIIVPRTTKDYAAFGKRTSLKNAKVADLILFSLYDDYNTIGHIGIICAIEQDKVFFIHAASGKSSKKVMISELTGVHLKRMRFITNVME
ncbi:C40 family peptidase [Taibaiella sp. KBW10]|uniref:C40 family peptidase n=1 Tax=Taibaiella sp. KBW10 TaxID=2153357 RepID=UPI0013153DA9|nr:C40 family peptidase [Taibaiella sp. KBW10]